MKVQGVKELTATNGPASTDLARGRALDALRFFASLFIVVFHLDYVSPVKLGDKIALFHRGHLATDFFLLLSGFILARIYGEQVLHRRISAGQFLARRFIRTYPAHLIVLVFLIGVALASDLTGADWRRSMNLSWSELPQHLFLVQGWGIKLESWNAPAWTISALMVCYLAFPWVWRLLHRIRNPLACVGLLLVVILGADFVAHALTGHAIFALRWGLVRAAPLFISGLLLARVVETLRPSNGFAGLIAGVGALVFLASVTRLHTGDVVEFLAIMAVIVGVGAGGGRIWPGAAWAAEISFALFITHMPFNGVYYRWIAPWLMGPEPSEATLWAIWTGCILCALAVAAAFHHLVDQPLQRWLRRTIPLGSRPGLASASQQGA
jgi:peptidoglycan/LPS O-acetylase OafA/YrhL